MKVRNDSIKGCRHLSLCPPRATSHNWDLLVAVIRYREHLSGRPQKCSRSSRNPVHVELESVSTMSRNTQSRPVAHIEVALPYAESIPNCSDDPQESAHVSRHSASNDACVSIGKWPVSRSIMFQLFRLFTRSCISFKSGCGGLVH